MPSIFCIVPISFSVPFLLGMPIWQFAICSSPGVQQFCHLITAWSDACQNMHHVQEACIDGGAAPDAIMEAQVT